MIPHLIVPSLIRPNRTFSSFCQVSGASERPCFFSRSYVKSCWKQLKAYVASNQEPLGSLLSFYARPKKGKERRTSSLPDLRSRFIWSRTISLRTPPPPCWKLISGLPYDLCANQTVLHLVSCALSHATSSPGVSWPELFTPVYRSSHHFPPMVCGVDGGST
jgi:hypothetical protein